MSLIASQITSLSIVYSTSYSGVDQRKHQSSASLAFVRGIHRGPLNSPHKRPVTRKMFPFDNVIMYTIWVTSYLTHHVAIAWLLRHRDTLFPRYHYFTLLRCHNGRDGVWNHHPRFAQPFIPVQIKENIKAPRHWPLCGEFTGHRWIPRTNGQ